MKPRTLFLTLIVALICLFCWFHPLFAAPYQPVEEIQILSQEKDETVSSDKLEQILWTVIPETNHDGSTRLSIYGQGSDQSVCELTISNSSVSIHLTGSGDPMQQLKNNEMILTPGFPVPCDVLPVSQLLNGQCDPKVYEIERMAGGQTFIDRLQVFCVSVDKTEALNNGWLKTDITPSSELWMIKVVDLRTREMLAQQLWTQEGSWWLYEQTPYRQSWLIK